MKKNWRGKAACVLITVLLACSAGCESHNQPSVSSAPPDAASSNVSSGSSDILTSSSLATSSSGSESNAGKVPLAGREPLAGKTVIAITGAPNLSMVLTSEGEVYACGTNFAGQYGNGTQENNANLIDNKDTKVAKVPLPEPAKYISTYGLVSTAVGKSNTVYIWGQFATMPYLYDHEKYPPYLTTPIAVPFDQEIIGIQACHGDILVLAKGGTVYSVGEGNLFGYQMIDISRTQEILDLFLKPIKLQMPEPVTQMFSNGMVACLVGQSGKAYFQTIIQGEGGGIFPDVKNKKLPYPLTSQIFREIPLQQKVKQISSRMGASGSYLLLLTEDGELHEWDVTKDYGKGVMGGPAFTPKFEKVDLQGVKANDVTDAGPYGVLFTTPEHEVYSYGETRLVANTMTESGLQKFPIKAAKLASCYNSYFFLDPENKLYVFGDNIRGQLYLPQLAETYLDGHSDIIPPEQAVPLDLFTWVPQE